MKRLLIGVALALSLAMNISFVLVFFMRQGMAGPMAGGMGPGQAPCLLDQIALAPAQQERLTAMRATMMALRKEHGQAAAEQRARLGDAITADAPDRAAIARSVEAYSASQRALQQRVVEHLLNVRALLDDGQREQFRQLLRTQIFRGLRAAEGDPEGGR